LAVPRQSKIAVSRRVFRASLVLAVTASAWAAGARHSPRGEWVEPLTGMRFVQYQPAPS